MSSARLETFDATASIAMSPLLAQSGHPNSALPMSHFGGKADIARTFANVRF
jgi:hypothetical protein